MKKHNFFIFIAEPHPILFKDSERREQYKMKKHNFFIFIAEPHPILFKDSERREQYKMKKHIFLFLLPRRSSCELFRTKMKN